MPRLIDADALLEGREDHEMISTHLIWNAPTIDAVEVVRCKDCEYFSEPNSLFGNGICISGKCDLRGDYIFTNDFCSYAVERRTDETD